MNVIGLVRALGLALIVFGFLLKLFCVKIRQDLWYGFLRNRILGTMLFVICVTWFMFKLSDLGEPDFGEYKHLLMFLFGFTFLGCYIYWSDFILVRAAAMFTLMSVEKLLNIAYMSEGVVKPFFATGIYLLIILAMYLGVYPYRVRDISPYLFQKDCRYMKLIGLFCMCYGVGLIGLTYL